LAGIAALGVDADAITAVDLRKRPNVRLDQLIGDPGVPQRLADALATLNGSTPDGAALPA
jgi:hypothetical protein